MSGQLGREVVIVEAVRTPIGRGHLEKGYYKDVHPDDLLGKTYTEVLARAGADAAEVEDVIVGQGLGAEMIADQWEIPRHELDELALRSHQLAHKATEEGKFGREIVAFPVNGSTYVSDQGIRPDTTLEALAALKPVFKEDGK